MLKGWLDKIPTPILALLGPVGLVLTAFKHWDDIKGIAKGAYKGIKLWLSTKPVALFTKIKGQVGKVIGFFSNMKDKIIGHGKAAYVGVKLWLMTKLGAISSKIKGKVDAVIGFFSDMSGKIVGFGKASYEGIKLWLSGKIGTISDTIKVKVDAITAFFGDMKDTVVGYAEAVYTGVETWMSTNLGAIFDVIKLKVEAVTGFFGAMKDGIVGIAEAVYNGVKTWMSDKIGAIFDGIKAKVDAVVGFFSGMKDTIVGNSIVPEMVNLVDSEFARMGTAMTDETASAKDEVVTNLEDMTEASNDLNDANGAIATSTQAATEKAPVYGIALAALAGQMGGAAGQAMNLVVAMRAHNEEQKLAAETGAATEKEFSKIQIGAATLGAAFSAIGEAVGGTAGAVLSELGTIASAFATGGVVAGIMAGIGSLVKGIKGLFGRGKKKREKAAAEEKARLAEVAAAAEEAAERMRAAAEKVAAEIKAYWDGIYNGAVSGYDRAQAAGVAAYDEIFLAAIESGLGQEEAIAAATAAQEEATAKTLAAEGEKFIRLAAFEAALHEIRNGNAAGAADAAVQAAADTRAAWETAMDAVTLADQAAGDSMIDTANKVAAIQEKQAAAAAAAQVAAAEAAKDAWTWEPSDSSGDDEIPGGFQDPEGFPGFQHGGPVQAGKPILVGEAGPELFIPSQGGRIDPNVSSAGGGANAKELAAAVSEALQNTRIEVDGRQLGRLTIRHQPIAVAELGGRR